MLLPPEPRVVNIIFIRSEVYRECYDECEAPTSSRLFYQFEIGSPLSSKPCRLYRNSSGVVG